VAVLPTANGGTNSSAAPTNGGVAYGTGTSIATTAAGTAGRVLTSNGAGAPTWNAPVRIFSFGGFAGLSIAPNSAVYVFAGPTTSITLTVPSILTGSAIAPLGTTTGIATIVRVGLCYQQGAGPITNFAGGNYSILEVDTTRTTASASASVLLGPGTYTVGFGIQNGGTVAINDNDYVNGWIMVTPQ
jgi:hypothetical protein